MISFDYACLQSFLDAKMVLNFKINGLVCITLYMSFSINPFPNSSLMFFKMAEQCRNFIEKHLIESRMLAN